MARHASVHRARLNEAYERHRGLVYAVALRAVRNRHDAEDVVHPASVNGLLHRGTGALRARLVADRLEPCVAAA